MNVSTEKCSACAGAGKVYELSRVMLGQKKLIPPDCPDCHGTGTKSLKQALS